MATNTPNYNFTLPAVADPVDADLWGGQLNSNWTAIDTILNANGIITAGGFSDSSFRVVDNGDNTKQVAFEASGITTSTTRTLTVQDADGTVYVTGGQDVSAADGGTGQSSYTVGDTIYASGTTAISKLGIGTASQVLTVNAGATAPEWVDAQTEESFTSAEVTINPADSGTVTHSLNSRILNVEAYLVCQVAEDSFSVGDEIGAFALGNNAGNNTSFVWWPSTDNAINYRFGSGFGGSPFSIVQPSSGANLTLTPSSWRCKFKIIKR
jgi:hypothetical protein